MDHIDLVECRRPWLRDMELTAGSTRACGAIADETLERIVAAYRLASAAERDRGVVRGGPWKRIRQDHMGELIGLLDAGAPGPLGDYLRHLPTQHGGHGFFQGKATTTSATASPAAERRRLVWIMDSVCGLAEAVGVKAVDCPERVRTGAVTLPRAEELICAVEAAVGMSISVPDVCAGLLGVAVGERVVHMRSACAVYAAWRIRRWLEEQAGKTLEQCRIAEIGPGIGLVAHALARYGTSRLCLIDLPELNAMQAFFLAQALPVHRLSLFGEPWRPEDAAIRIIPDFEFLDAETPTFDLILNQDSMPEMDLETVRRYLGKIPATTDWFLSINQETQVPEGAPPRGGFLPGMIRESAGCRPLFRVPCWSRQGYVEEMVWCRGRETA